MSRNILIISINNIKEAKELKSKINSRSATNIETVELFDELGVFRLGREHINKPDKIIFAVKPTHSAKQSELLSLGTRISQFIKSDIFDGLGSQHTEIVFLNSTSEQAQQIAETAKIEKYTIAQSEKDFIRIADSLGKTPLRTKAQADGRELDTSRRRRPLLAQCVSSSAFHLLKQRDAAETDSTEATTSSPT